MRKKLIAIMVAFMICILFSACTAKLTTIRPTLITRIVVENAVTGEKAELIRKDNVETDWLMDDLILQMEQPYSVKGNCEQSEGQMYHVEFYMDNKLELNVSINSDGSVCRNGKQHIQNEQGNNVVDRSVNLDLWAECFGISETE